MERFNERANALASEYWRLKHLTSKEEDEERLEEIERLLEKGIGGKLREKLEREARLLRQAREERSNAMRNLEIVREELVPPAVVEVIREISGVERLRELAKSVKEE